MFITTTAGEVRERMRDPIVVRKPIMANDLSRAVAEAGLAGQISDQA